MTDVIITKQESTAVIVTDQKINVIKDTSIGPQGKSAYDLAVANGFIGTEQQWIDSLVGNQEDIVVTKSVGELANLTINFSNRLLPNDYLTEVVSVIPAPAGLAVSGIGFTSNTVYFKVGAGDQLQGYKIEISVTTNLGSQFTASIYLLNT